MKAWPIRIAAEDRDAHRTVTVLAAAGLAAGAALALFGLPPADLHGPLHYVGIMDPLCGGTRGVRAAMSGDLALAWRYNPISIPLVLGAAALLARQAAGLATRRWLNARIASRRALWTLTAGLLVALEINQQLHADLLRSSQGFSLAGPVAFAALGALACLMVWLFRRSAPDRP